MKLFKKIRAEPDGGARVDQAEWLSDGCCIVGAGLLDAGVAVLLGTAAALIVAGLLLLGFGIAMAVGQNRGDCQ